MKKKERKESVGKGGREKGAEKVKMEERERREGESDGERKNVKERG